MYCEICGNTIESSKARKVFIDGANLTLCPMCLARLSSKPATQTSVQQQPKAKPMQFQRSSSTIAQQPGRQKSLTNTSSSTIKKGMKSSSEKLELVEDFAERIRRARESRGWDQRTLAAKLKVGENIVKRIESGKLRPPIDLARKIEEVLGIKLLVPAIEEVLEKSRAEKYVTFGEIVSIRGVEEEK